MAINFEEEKAKNILQGLSFEICDCCTIDPLRCGFRYGNRFKCDILAKKIDKMFMHDV